MKKKFSTAWNASKQPRKQRKYRANAPLHTKHKFLGVHLSKELRAKHGVRSLAVITGDKVKVLRGQHSKKEGKVERIDIKETKVYITGIDTIKKDGSKSLYPINPSNLMITDLNLDDKKRIKAAAKETKKVETKVE